MKLFDLYDNTPLLEPPHSPSAIAYQLLAERETHESISHRAMPTWIQHEAYVRSRPHKHWYWFRSAAGVPAGCIYLTAQREIGIGVLRSCRGQGLAKAAIAEVARRHRGRFLANINPDNEASIALFRKLGFGGPIQITLEKR